MAWTKVKHFLALIDFGHTLFGLPFTYMSACIAMRGVPSISQLLWITLAMISARTAALCLNRLIDQRIDSLNPRTANWILPSGKLKPKPIWVLCILFIALLFYSAYHLNPLCFKLAPLAVIALAGYSYTKRFTWWCHLILGLVIGIGPVGGWIAITGTFDSSSLLLGLVVATWIAGFDTMYACQDIAFDRDQGLFSIPARFGEKRALIFSSGFHLLTIILLVITGFVFDLDRFFLLGTLISAGILLIEHNIVKPGDFKHINLASFGLNRYMGLVMLLAALLDIFF